MKQVLVGLLGFLIALLTLSFLSSLGPGAVFFVYGVLVYSLFFADHGWSTSLLVGFTVGLELLATHRFGTAALTSVLGYGFYLLFGVQLRFTSAYARFIVALALTLLTASALLYPISTYLNRIPSVLISAVLVILAGLLLYRATRPSSYELL